MRARGKSPSMSGFGLIEVLVSLVVISVGLLGVAKLYALSIGNTRVSGSRALAAIYVGSLSSAMHANQAYWQAPGTATTNVTTSVNADFTITLSDSLLNAQTASCAANFCGPTAMAANDLRTWGTGLRQLPAGNGTVACTSVSPVNCTITIKWTEKFIAATASQVNQSAQAPTAQQTFVAVVQP